MIRGTSPFIEKLTEILAGRKVISSAEALALKKSFANSSLGAFDEFLLEEGLVSKENLLTSLSDYYQTPCVDVQGYQFESFLLRSFPKDVMIRNAFIPMAVDNETMIIVAQEPERPGLRELIGHYVTYNIQFCVGIGTDIIDNVQDYWDSSLTQVPADSDLHREHDQEVQASQEMTTEDDVIAGDEQLAIIEDEKDEYQDNE